ncbi:MAG: signal peptidase I [Candidatus Melainabacteria bacterium]|nr:signal peptidase I [Candidatus Melainabacteria bacterium]
MKPGEHKRLGSEAEAGAGAKVEVEKQAEVAVNTREVQAQADDSEKGGFFKGIVRELVELVVVTLILLIAIRWIIGEARYIPSASMEPTLQIEDRLIVEKISKNLGHPIQRGDILVFYPPPVEMGGRDLRNDPLHIFGRLTGLPFLPNEPAFIKRVIGLPGDHIRVQAGVGVFINGQLLDESAYIKEVPEYNLNVLGDIGGHNTTGEHIQPYGVKKEPIIVPAGHLFMMGDNRNNSEDSHVWGFLDQKRIIGRAWVLIWRRLNPPIYPRILNE